MPSVPNPVIEKIRKLQALAERAGTEAEAANAAARVRELLEKHNLDIGTVQLEAEPGCEQVSHAIGKRKPHYNVVARTLCDLFDVECFWVGKGSKWRVAFVGLEANVETARLTFHWLLESIEALLEGWKKTRHIGEGFLFGCKPFDKDEYVAFRNGAAMRIRDLAMERKRAAMRASQSMELVRIGNAVAKRMVEQLEFRGTYDPSVKPAKKAELAFREGYRQGSRVDFEGAHEGRMIRGKE